jgi:hypothetical protein
MMRNALVIAAALGATLPAAAAGSGAFGALKGKLIPNGCAGGASCSYLSIDAADAAGTSAKGALFKLNVKYWYDANGKKTNNSSETVYVFCSRTTPAYIYDDGSAWQAVMLAPGNQETIAEANRQALVTYWAACHATAVTDPGDQAPALAKRFGYDVSAQSEDKEITNPSDALTW